MAREKKRRKGQADLNDFHRDLNGNYTYEGTLLTYDTPDLPRKRAMALLWLLCGAAMVLLLIAGFLPAPGATGQILIVLPFACAFVASVSVCWALARLTSGGDPLRGYVYEGTVEKLPMRMVLTIVFSVVAAVGESIYLFSNGAQVGALFAVLFLLCHILAAAAILVAYKILKKMRWVEKK